MTINVRQRVTLSLAEKLVEALDRAPGNSRSAKVERLVAEALAARAHRRWKSELAGFYATPDMEERAEDVDWQALTAQAFDRDD
jgi:metal-responsive CopG/Arc/MetJ family transcriptional regulator